MEWTRSRAYKKNDQALVEQKNFTHACQLLGYGRFGELDLKPLVNDLYEKAWLPTRNAFTPPVSFFIGSIRMRSASNQVVSAACKRV